ncbi:uncharacterized protein V6R79_019392 [Siganus canaliculatus]
MDVVVTFILLLRCWTVWSLSRGQSVSFSMVFSDGTQLVVDVVEDKIHCDEKDLHRHQKKTAGSGPSVQVLSSFPLAHNPGSPQLLVCLVSGLNSRRQHVLWWVDHKVVTASNVMWTRPEGGETYSAMAVWEFSSAADWTSISKYWCGTIQGGRVFRQRVC